MSTTALAIIRPENIATIVKAAPESYNENRQSHDRCIKACKELFDNIQKQGMTDQLDQQAALFIDRSRRTLKAMNTRRSAVTKLFDEVRSAYTTIENDIDPTRPGTILISFSSSATSMPHANARRNCAASARKPSVSVVKQHAPSILPMLRTT